MGERGSFYPNIFSRLDQGSEARDRNIAHALAARGRDRILTPKFVTSNFFSDQRGSVSPRILATLPAAALLLLSSSLLTACRPANNPAVSTPTREPTSTPQVCIPDEFVKLHGYPTPIGRGGQNPPDEVFRQMLEIREKLDTCQTLTPEEQTAVNEFNQNYSPSPGVISEKTVQFVILSPADMLSMQNEAAARGEFKLFSPAEIVQLNGTITQSPKLSNGEIDLFIGNVPPKVSITFPALVSGKVTTAARANATANSIEIETGNQRWFFLTPRTSTILVTKGQTVTLGTSLFSVSYNPEDPIQTGFERGGAGTPSSTIVLIGRQDITTKKFQQVTLNDFFRTPDGAFPTVSSTRGK